MHFSIKKSFIFNLFGSFFLFCACRPSPAQPYKIPPHATPESFVKGEEFFSPLPTAPMEQITAIEQAPSNRDENIWQVDDVDISEIDQSRKLIAFTFDDAPKHSLENILAIFAAFNEQNPDHKASATLFCNGIFIDQSTLPSLYTAWTMQFELGNHTQSHTDLTKLSKQALQEEITKTDKLLCQVDGKRLHLLRAPYGKLNDQVKALVSVPIIDWTIDTLDWKGTSSEAIYNEVMTNKADGSIVLFHDGYPNTMSALKRLLPDLKKEGYQVVSISKMAKAHACPLRNGSVYIRARKQK